MKTEAKRKTDQAYRERNRERLRAWQRTYRELNRARVRATNRAWQERNREQVRTGNRDSYAKSRDAVLRRQKAYQELTRAEVRARNRAWALANPAKTRAFSAKRRAARLQRTPAWLTQAHWAEIEGQYHFAKVMEQITGQKHHVDHIEPLQGRDVSGLHVPWNLRVIPAQENQKKHNRRVEVKWQRST